MGPELRTEFGSGDLVVLHSKMLLMLWKSMRSPTEYLKKKVNDGSIEYNNISGWKGVKIVKKTKSG